MNTTSQNPNPPSNRRRNADRPDRALQHAHQAAANPSPQLLRDFDAMSMGGPVVEHRTVPEFLRAIDYDWTLVEVRRFGYLLEQGAQGLCLAYTTACDVSLGVLRAFPVPMMKRVYNLERLKSGWPALPGEDSDAAENVQKLRTQVKKTEKALERMREVIAETESVETIEAMRKAEVRMEEELKRLQALQAMPATTLPRG